MSKRKHPSCHTTEWKKHKKPYVKFSGELPRFLDAESGVTASTFGARRLPEMRKMWQSFQTDCSAVNHDDEAYYRSGGCKISRRHLRRRTGSHHRKRRHRYPSQKKESHVSVHERSEMLKPDVLDDSKVNRGIENEKKLLCRRARRKPKLLREEHSQWKFANVEEKCTDAPPKSMWLETHLWHTKRFYMSPPMSIYNHWCIPLGHTNRGSRAALRLSKTKSTIQDATWTVAGKSIILQTELDNIEFLLDIVESICGRNRKHSAPFLLNERVILGLEVGYGLVYDLRRSFPNGVVGPASFLFGRNDKVLFVQIYVEGSIVNRVQDMIHETIKDAENEYGNECSLSNTAMTLIRVRGAGATGVIKQSLEIHDLRNKLDWRKLSDKSNLHASLPHGTILEVQYESSRKESNLEECNQDAGGSEVEYSRTVQAGIRENEKSILTSPRMDDTKLILISQMPVENKDKASNYAVSGWDILCPPSLTTKIFKALNEIGGACAIGHIEDSCNRMEAEPPLPVWPRDYPDTRTGREYWEAHNNEWSILRYCFEEGCAGGRIKTGLKRMLNKCSDRNSNARVTASKKTNLQSIDWTSIVATADKATESLKNSVIVVRGDYTMPFIQALTGFSQHYINTKNSQTDDDEEMKRNKHRTRRKVREFNKSVTLPPIETRLLTEHGHFCTTLLKSLSFPALLRCQLVVEGKGKVCPGGIISCCISRSGGDANAVSYESNVTTQTLGYVCTGGFSQSRGISHGVGIISSQVFLSFLIYGVHRRFMWVNRNDQSTTAVRVTIKYGNEDSKSSLSASLTLLS